jgi:hypothetical protein
MMLAMSMAMQHYNHNHTGVGDEQAEATPATTGVAGSTRPGR